ncbi:MAG: extracellular solute-binding protein [Brachybacterium sp.]|uniref:extracellular solute-binding protein n=1 Tax=Brachybacterium sp. TaxID=1891286 RepID=UPI0026494233|nr:extracellular solute-binding protein [Brachybacterium sp.]MDN5686768.1 extracellular solute-binding protein [Brachybacterium sp.]
MITEIISRRQMVQGALGVSALTALGATGCSNEGRGGADIADNSGGTLPDYIPFEGIPMDLEGEDGVSDTMLGYPESPVAVTDGPPSDGENINVFAVTNTPPPPGLDSNEYWQALNERLGCTLSVSLVPTGDFADRFQTAVAGNQLPAVFSYFHNQVPGLPAFLNERAADLTEMLAGSAVKNYPFLANIPTASWRATMYGGKIYGVPIPRGPQSSMVMYAREDLLEQMGIEFAPDSWETFLDFCREITGGGKWALGSVPITYIRQMMGIPNAWFEDGGTLVSANEHERQEEALEAGRKLVSEGLIHPDGFTANNPQRKTWTVNGTTPIISGTYSAWNDFSNYPIPEGFRLRVVGPPDAEGDGSRPIWLGAPTHNLTSISVDAQDRAESLLSFLNYLAAPFGSQEHLFKNYGLKGVHHELEGTNPVLTEKGRKESQLGLEYMAEGPWVNYHSDDPDVAQAQYDSQRELVPTAVPNPVEGLYSNTMSRKGNQIDSALGSAQNDILQSREAVSSWADAVATWKRDGGDTIKDELEEALANSQGS